MQKWSRFANHQIALSKLRKVRNECVSWVGGLISFANTYALISYLLLLSATLDQAEDVVQFVSQYIKQNVKNKVQYISTNSPM